VISKAGSALGAALKGPKYKKEDYIELLSVMFAVFKLAKSKGMLSLETHIENPHDSDLFNQFAGFASNHHALTFLCDYLRLISLGTENPHELESLMDEEIETHHKEHHAIAAAIQGMADGMPALGIVAAVLGVIKTMGAITEPPEVLGKLIGGALVGTFLGVFLAYGFIGPIASQLNATYDAETKYFQCMKAGLLAYLQGYAPAICVEFARKALLSDVRPTFYEVEEAVSQVPAAGG
jgi:chemotaxis protein MotA